jgi:predicted GNAT superfamily acetyltransferase
MMAPGLSASEVEIRPCETLAEYSECVRLQGAVWGREMAVPSAIFVVARHTGGQVLGAFHGDTLVGFSLALIAARARKPYLHSHMTAVLPEFADRGVGRSLKLFQRQDALKGGMDLIEWTFDPLELKNAHFNLVRLGAVARRFIPNCYGVTASPLHAGLPTDRIVAEWWLDSERVKSILADDVRPMKNAVERLSLPSNLGEVKSSGSPASGHIQARARAEFERMFAQDYVATGVESCGATVDYILEPAAGIDGLQLEPFTEARHS